MLTIGPQRLRASACHRLPASACLRLRASACQDLRVSACQDLRASACPRHPENGQIKTDTSINLEHID